ncbi:TRAP transporter small permease subunit [Defluviitalea raffinosedens]|uniref:TRAP transporter small permease subunit n=1 Tax=Defluviitalea raffinosedens TaxID=1450156 RepID=A0A7C8LI14_9FIRM|nr:TRAP transporter small permease [Defluviitalea raffinosedens]KAE9634502.1 TRAP transporter small permease subunit [Defluviitalea raffinosedens]
MKKFVKVYNDIMTYIALVCLLGFVISVLIQVFSRTFLPFFPSWTEEAARYLFIYMVAFGGSVAVRKNEYVGVEILSDMLPEKAQRILKIAILIALAVFSGYVLINSTMGFALIKYRMVSTAMQIPMQYVYGSLLVFFGLLVFSYILEIILVLTKQDTRE